MVGIMNAISSGLLLFAGLVELLAEDFLSDESYVILRGRRRVQACGAVAAGGFGMALIGAWVGFFPSLSSLLQLLTVCRLDLVWYGRWG